MTASHGSEAEVEALVVDRYLESLLARRPVDPTGVPDDLRATAATLATSLPRFHPSFRFEEALAARLAAAARGIHPGDLVELGAPGGRSGDGGHAAAGRAARPHPAVIGGVVTSAALSLAGAAYVAWRRRQPADPMTRAVRAVARARLV